MASRRSAGLAAAASQGETVVMGASGGRASSLTVTSAASGPIGMAGDDASGPNDGKDGFPTPFPDAPRASSGDDAEEGRSRMDVVAFLCGPPKMSDAMEKTLLKLGLPKQNVRLERWW